MADVTAWLWSPSAPAMDMRSYRSADGMDTFEKQFSDLDVRSGAWHGVCAGWRVAGAGAEVAASHPAPRSSHTRHHRNRNP
jgi:hypothetical protein